ncbi:MAG: NTP transferase domain-containing protein [Verrucomicrobia bacterium]|nr:NTP transferase domain-containing protein [Verrucomicrobiota bacterium]
MKGVVLAGGLGTRLHPLTKITNKHLLPVYKKPMIYYPIEMLVDAGITDIMIVTGGNSAGDFLRLIGNGKDFGLSRIHYTYQEGEGGIADALSLAEEFTEGEKFVVVLGDNILEKGVREGVSAFEKQETGARIFLTEVDHPWEYGIAEIEGDRVKRIIEKPKDPPTNLAVIGVYMYSPDVFDMIRKLEPSARGELEITDVNNMYINAGGLEYQVLDGWWLDAGENHEALLQANITVARSEGADV